MIENELIQIWQSSPKHERIKFEKSKLMLDVQSSLARFDRTTRFWDFGTLISAISMMGVFAYQAYLQPNLLTKFGMILIVFWSLLLVYIVIKLKKTKPDDAVAYLDFLNQNKKYLDNHMSLSNRFMRLTVLPCFSGIILIMIGKMDLLSKPWHEIANITTIWIQLSILVVVGIFAYYMNKWVVKKEFLPRLKKVNELIRLMEEE